MVILDFGSHYNYFFDLHVCANGNCTGWNYFDDKHELFTLQISKRKKKKEKLQNKVSYLIPPPLKYVSLKVHHVSRQKVERAPYGMPLNLFLLLCIVPGGPHMNFVGLALDLQLEGGTWAKDLKIGYNIFWSCTVGSKM